MTKKVNLPKHDNPTKDDRTACAPYNFVPLPETVVPAVESAKKLPNHNRYDPELYTGYFDVTLTTMSPVYIRGPIPRPDFPKLDEEGQEKLRFRERVTNRPDFFYTHNWNEPLIPGSSLRGMLRAVLEIASYSKVQWVTDKKLFFRTVDKTSVGRYYRGILTGKVEGGFYRRVRGKHRIIPCEVLRVPRHLVPGRLYRGRAPSKVPVWDPRPVHQWAPVWVRRSSGVVVDEISFAPKSTSESDQWLEGKLVVTGDVPGKKKEFVFLLPTDEDKEAAIEVDEELIELFHDDDQITQWQQDAFPKHQPVRDARKRDGFLRSQPDDPGDPVFFVRERGKVLFFGRAHMFRLPYRDTPQDLVPEELRDPCLIDYAEALFGYVRTAEELDWMEREGLGRPEQGDKRRAYAGRVFVTDAVLDEGQGHDKDLWLVSKGVPKVTAKPVREGGQGEVLVDPDEGTLVPKILASPKPTAFQMYLTQDNPDDGRRLYHYDSNEQHGRRVTTIRGIKRYWHQGLNENKGMSPDEIVHHIREREDTQLSRDDTQHTVMRPLSPGVRFHFRVYFENLSKEELGALCWALHPLGEKDKEYYHHLGMGKPLGMGSVKLDAVLHLADRQKRYEKLFSLEDGKLGWQEGAEPEKHRLTDRAALDRRVRPFERHVLKQLGTNVEHLHEVNRIQTLLKMMEWPGFRARWDDDKRKGNTRYMQIEWQTQRGGKVNEYRYRPVLPGPLEVATQATAGVSSGSVSAPFAARNQGADGSQTRPPSQPRSRRETAGTQGNPPTPATDAAALSAWATIESDEVVRLVSPVQGDRATVRTEDDHEVVCERIPDEQGRDLLIARVRREGGRPVRARFRRWG